MYNAYKEMEGGEEEEKKRRKSSAYSLHQDIDVIRQRQDYPRGHSIILRSLERFFP